MPHKLANLLPQLSGVRITTTQHHRRFWIFGLKAQNFLGFHAVPVLSHGVIHRVYRRDYRPLITLPYAALGRASRRRTARTLGIREMLRRRHTDCPRCPTRPYRSVGQCPTRRVAERQADLRGATRGLVAARANGHQ